MPLTEFSLPIAVSHDGGHTWERRTATGIARILSEGYQEELCAFGYRLKVLECPEYRRGEIIHCYPADLTWRGRR